MRLDKFLAETGNITRSEAKKYLAKNQVTVNGEVIKNGKTQVNENTDEVFLADQKLTYQKFFYYMLNKPAGVVSATTDARDKTVLDLFSKEDTRADLFPVGRLDKDTVGLLLITNDGELAHNLLSPKKHVDKTYYAKIAGVATLKTVGKFQDGIVLRSGEETKPGTLKIISTDTEKNTSEIELTITEGKFHQVKRMFEAQGMRVTYLKRLRMGNLVLDPALPRGAYRVVSADEIEQISK
jgi:16S rRNA pseudouridine516 synthase